MKLGVLTFVPARDRPELLAPPVAQTIRAQHLDAAMVAAIDPTLSDTAAFCEQCQIGLDISANCVIVEAKRADRTWYAACMILATERIDINNMVRRHLDARKISFAPMETAIRLTGMEYGGITPIGLPADWPLLVDMAVAAAPQVIIGGGNRVSKLLVPGKLLAGLPQATVLDLAQHG